MPMVAAVAAVVSTVVSVTGAVISGQQQAAAADYQAKVAAQNQRAQADAARYQADIEKSNAITASAQANQAEELQRRRFRALQAEAITGMAQSGTDPTSGSNLLVLNQNSLYSELDALNIRYQGQQKAQGLMAQSELTSFGAGINNINAETSLAAGRMASSNALTSGYMSAGANLLAGASNIYKAGGKAGWWK